jgi:predicted ATPase
VLPGREREGALLEDLLGRVRGGHSAAIVVRGEAGVGKTALLNDAFEPATDVRVVRAAGIESEMELPYAGLQQLCLSMLDHLQRLPRRNRMRCERPSA